MLHKLRADIVAWLKVAGKGFVKDTHLSSQSSTMHGLGTTILWLTLVGRFPFYYARRELRRRTPQSHIWLGLRRSSPFLTWLASLDGLRSFTGFFTSTAITADVRSHFPYTAAAVDGPTLFLVLVPLDACALGVEKCLEVWYTKWSFLDFARASCNLHLSQGLYWNGRNVLESMVQ